MKSLFFFSFFIAINFFSIAQSIDIDKLRNEYYKVNTDSISCAKLYNKISKESSVSSDNTFLCYKGAIIAAMANHSKNKQEKIKLFNQGKKLIEQSIEKDSNNVELHFLRYTLQSNCPRALGYNKQLELDKKFIVANYSLIKNISLKKEIANFVLQSSNFSEVEKQKIKY